MKIMVTGGNGLIGSAISRIDSDHEIVAVTRENADLTSFAETESIVSAIQPDAIIHAAALVGGIGGNLMKSGEYFRDNILINTNVLEAARKSGIANLTTFMSTCIFPNSSTYPITVEQLHEGEPHPSNFAYAYAKRMLDIQVRAYNQQWGTKFKILIPTNVYGPNDNFNLEEGHAVAAIIHRMYLAKRNNESFQVWGTGKALREFVFAEDIARISLETVTLKELDSPIIVTNASETSIQQLVEVVAEALNFHNPIYFDPSMPEGQLRKPSSDLKFREIWPDFEFTSLRAGIAETVNWFEASYPNLRS